MPQNDDWRLETMTLDDYDPAYALWKASPGIDVHDPEDSREGIRLFLEHNPGMSLVARADGKVVGAVLCGHNGRRGMLTHLAVAPEYHKRGIGKALIEAALDRLRAEGIRGVMAGVYNSNTSAHEFYRRLGWLPQGEWEWIWKRLG